MESVTANRGIFGPRYFILTLSGIAIFLVLWSPVFWVPFWQDDYFFLLSTREAIQAGKPWFSALFPDSLSCFWRPLSTGIYWRFIEQVLCENIWAAHALNIILALMASACVGWLTATFLSIHCPETDATYGGLVAGFLYGIHGSRFLSIAWISGSQELFMILFCALTLRYWLIAATTTGRRGNLAGATVILCTVLALLSKETAVVLPALELLLVAWIWPKHKPTRRTWLLGMCSIALIGMWWLVHQRFVLPPPPPYQMKLGINVPRNTVSLVLFSLNMPREAIRFVLVEHSIWAGIWGLVCLGTQVAGCVLLFYGSTAIVRRRDFCMLALIAIVGLAPHLFLAWNCYEYYTSIALISYVILAGMTARATRRVYGALMIIVMSSVIYIAGNLSLDYPALVARACWVQRQLQIVKSLHDANPEAFQGTIYLKVENDHKFQGFGVCGLAYILNLRAENVVVLSCNEDTSDIRRRALVVPGEGDVYLEK